MKKLLIASLALITVLTMSLTACSNDPANEGDSGLDDDFISRDDATSTGEGEETTGGAETTGGVNNPSTPTGTWIERSNETVYVLGDGVNLRTAPNTSDASKAEKVNMGTALTRVKMQDVNEKNTDGWSEVTYDGKTRYVLSALLTTTQNDTIFEACEEKAITLDSDISYVFLRNAPADQTDVTKAKDFSAADFNSKNVTVFEVNKSKTWAKVKYDGKTYYLGYSTFDGQGGSGNPGIG